MSKLPIDRDIAKMAEDLVNMMEGIGMGNEQGIAYLFMVAGALAVRNEIEHAHLDVPVLGKVVTVSLKLKVDHRDN